MGCAWIKRDHLSDSSPPPTPLKTRNAVLVGRTTEFHMVSPFKQKRVVFNTVSGRESPQGIEIQLVEDLRHQYELNLVEQNLLAALNTAMAPLLLPNVACIGNQGDLSLIEQPLLAGEGAGAEPNTAKALVQVVAPRASAPIPDLTPLDQANQTDLEDAGSGSLYSSDVASRYGFILCMDGDTDSDDEESEETILSSSSNSMENLEQEV